ncbi:hypothetical protein niasHT_023737 [Heterodera trifolii]|uniref:Uncharacterized protein n=1 Tax=Heterodera trifolii TaxID=157864 RepID=A0ABD2K1V4_9BILA
MCCRGSVVLNLALALLLIRLSFPHLKSRLTPYAEHKTVHELLKRISGEIETIHELCRRDEVRDRLDAVLAVLKRVASSVDQITTTWNRQK